MAQGLFRQFTKASVIAIRNKAEEQLTDGKIMIEWTEGDSAGKMVQGMSIKDVLAECIDALQYLDPDTYGPVITRTEPEYR